jgi:hypothetical protein
MSRKLTAPQQRILERLSKPKCYFRVLGDVEHIKAGTGLEYACQSAAVPGDIVLIQPDNGGTLTISPSKVQEVPGP